LTFLRPSPLALQGWVHPRLRRTHRPAFLLPRVPPHVLHADVSSRLPPQEAAAQPRALRALHLQGHAPTGSARSRLLPWNRCASPEAARNALQELPSLATLANEEASWHLGHVSARRARDVRTLQALGARHGARRHRAFELLCR